MQFSSSTHAAPCISNSIIIANCMQMQSEYICLHGAGTGRMFCPCIYRHRKSQLAIQLQLVLVCTATVLMVVGTSHGQVNIPKLHKSLI